MTTTDLWLDAGEAAYHGARDLDLYPSLNDIEAQRWWLGGFAAAWAASPDSQVEHCGGCATLEIALEGKPELCQQLLERGIQQQA